VSAHGSGDGGRRCNDSLGGSSKVDREQRKIRDHGRKEEEEK